MKHLAVAVAVGLSMVPTAAAAIGPSPDPTALKKMLVNAPDSGWVETVLGDANTMEGPFDAQGFVQNAYGDAQTQQDAKSRLTLDGFVAGYARSFYKASIKGLMEEDVVAFDSKAGAAAFWGWVKSWLPESSDNTSSVDTSAIPNSFGGNYVASGFHGTEVLFVKGVNMFDIVVGSDSAYLQTVGVALARSAFEFAPAGDAPVYLQTTPLSSSAPPPGNGISIAVFSLIFLSLGACLIGGLIAAIFLVRRRPTPPLRTVLSPDGNYWWDGRSWQPVPRA